MFELHAVRDKSGQTRNGEDLLEMQGLTLIDKIQHPVSIKRLMSIAHCCQIGCRIQLATTGLLDNRRQGIAFGILELIEKYALCALAFGQKPRRA